MRPPTEDEKRLITKVAKTLGGAEGAQLLEDLPRTTVASATSDGSRVEFEIAGYTRPVYRGQHPFGIEGKMLDRDGTELSVLLHADENGRLYELEFVRWDGNTAVSPDWRTLRLENART